MNKKEELYQEIVSGIQQKYDGKLSTKEAYVAARNLIEFVRIMLKIKAK